MPKLTKEERLEKNLASQVAKEEMYQLVSKIISWKTKAPDSHSIQKQDKISKEEWQRYETHLLEISKTEYVENVKEKLKKIFQTIQNNEGFE